MLYIVNKKRFTLFVLLLLLSVGALSFLVIKATIQFKEGAACMAREQSEKQKTENQKISDTKTDVTKPDPKAIQTKDVPSVNTEYTNQLYGYKVAFPSAWYLNTDSSETNLSTKNIDGKNIGSGGQTFWSNYKNINDYSPDQKPEDFHLLGLTVYEAQGISADDLATVLGYDQNSIIKKDPFQGNDISGTEYVAAGLDEKNPQVMIILTRGQRFYVFNLAFINGDVESANVMEGIVRTFSPK